MVHQDEFKRLSQSPEKLTAEIAKILSSGGIFNKNKTLRETDVAAEVEEINKANQIKQK
ncbi:hypothetical protein FACS1894218_7080 [Bacilli bacterium]|nr:hypothetical protein FACS1894218_7080 [Bacilli bacterium]